jgi:glucokinase
MSKYCVGIDLGGTFIKSGLLDENRRPTVTLEIPTPIRDGREAVVAALVASARAAMEAGGVSTKDVVGVGIGSPGPISISKGLIITLPNIPGMSNVPLRDLLSAELGLPAVLENDANAAALGEYLCGAGGRKGDIVLLTLGTGVGSGIIVDGRILHGSHEIGAEMGHLIVQPGGELCNCGQHGCLERYSSATYLAEYGVRLLESSSRPSSLRDLKAKKKAVDSKAILAAAQAGDELAREVWDRAIYYLAVGCVSICRIFDPERILLGGGMARAGDALLNPVREQFKKLHWHLTPIVTEIHLASLGSDAGVIGAAGAAWAAMTDWKSD